MLAGVLVISLHALGLSICENFCRQYSLWLETNALMLIFERYTRSVNGENAIPIPRIFDLG